MILIVAAGLVFVAITTLVVGVWWAHATGDQLRRRLGSRVQASSSAPELLRPDAALSTPSWERVLRKSDLVGQLAQLAEQAGSPRSATQLLLTIGVVATLAGLLGGWRTGTAAGALISAVVGGAAPVLRLLYRRHRRLHCQ